MASRIGLRAPVHSTAAGKVLAADLSPAELESVLAAATFARMTPRTITSQDEFLAELATGTPASRPGEWTDTGVGHSTAAQARPPTPRPHP